MERTLFFVIFLWESETLDVLFFSIYFARSALFGTYMMLTTIPEYRRNDTLLVTRFAIWSTWIRNDAHRHARHVVTCCCRRCFLLIAAGAASSVALLLVLVLVLVDAEETSACI